MDRVPGPDSRTEEDLGPDCRSDAIVEAVSGASLPAGKLPSDLLAELLGELEPLPPEVQLGPAIGEDACALDLPAGVLVAATDPITLTGREIGHLAVTVNANDVAVMGVRPRWFLATVLFPLGTTEAQVWELFATMRHALGVIGATLVGGHTEITGVVRQPVVVGQMLGQAEHGRFVSTSGARPGDVVVQVGAAPVEAAAVLASEMAAQLGRLSRDVVLAAAGGFDDPGISVVDAALAAADLGATALHDPTEGGLAGGLHELAAAAEIAIRVDRTRILWFEPALAVCRMVDVDPWAALASGALLATFAAPEAAHAVEQLISRGYLAAAIGVAESGDGVRDIHDEPIVRPDRDEVARLLSP